ncbi:hypothetical protein [Aquimarina brevivitae]|uniref:Outer membrane beta-barrel protein n=1 Tax=Aquimarina brevivitae TaxID=323412 RepID=A0A4Q7PFX7_9FLAO|nr:hypothetical protein [Aquimarina brevivitae]RZS99394.1 hypothetical protein EV197_0604 [Aquimarina brevivitae]
MIKVVKKLGVFFLFGIFFSNAQEIPSHTTTKQFAISDTIRIDTVSINPAVFQVFIRDSLVEKSKYAINFEKAILVPSGVLKKRSDSISVVYKRYPDFLTRAYFEFDPKIIVNSTGNLEKLYALSSPNTKEEFTPFDGLTTSGSISRGVTVGTNQNAVLNSELDLQITGKISEKVSLRASIQDANVPVQQGGYSQNLDEFDQIFIELNSKNWNVRAGDVILQNTESYFSRFTKNVQGISINAALDHTTSKTNVFASGALVRGVFNRSQFTGQEGNQGPYKLTGPNGELFILVVSGSERVYVNGLLLERGENEDYVIDYNAGEVTFNPTYPITSDMRISIEYQTTERSYARIIAYGGGVHQSDKLKLGAYVYSENDAKNQSLQQNLNDDQKQILAQAGDDSSQMIAPSAVPDTFDENKILYRKEVVDGVEVFVYSTDPEDELFNVRFTQVGTNQGNYRVSNVNTISRVFEYVAPIDGVPQGDFEPVIQLQAPTKLQIGVVQGTYDPSSKTSISFELAGSKKDLNLFSDIGDNDNNGFAGRMLWNQKLIQRDSSWTLNFFAGGDYVQDQYNSIERIYNVEFSRDWNLTNPLGNQQLLTSGMHLIHPQKGAAKYSFEQLNFSENYKGNRHSLNANLTLGRLRVASVTSLLNSNSSTIDSRFFRTYSGVSYGFDKSWIGTRTSIEENKEINKADVQYTNNTQRFKSYLVYAGVGDSTKIYTELGYKHRINDSVRNNKLNTISVSNTYYLKSNLISNSKTRLSLFLNYRNLNNLNENQSDEESFNSRLLYNQRFFGNKMDWNTVYETNSGTLAQQEYTFVEVDPGRGTHVWNDYNNNGIQELNEFEIAQFTDQATFLRILLPNQVFVQTHQNKLSQIITLNPNSWVNSNNSTLQFLSHFYNQTAYIIERKNRRQGAEFRLNPFNESDNELGLNLSFRNTLFYNRGKQKYTTAYTYVSSKSKNLLLTGLQENTQQSHQFNFTHKIANLWLLDLKSDLVEISSSSENFDNRNYELNGYILTPKVSYLLSDQTQFSLSYTLDEQKNDLGLEQLTQQNLSISFAYANKQSFSVLGEINYVNNDFTGNAFSPVGYQLLDGLQPGNNFTWSLIAQKKLTKFLDLNLNYSGRKSESSSTIHTGSVQLRALF